MDKLFVKKPLAIGYIIAKNPENDILKTEKKDTTKILVNVVVIGF